MRGRQHPRLLRRRHPHVDGAQPPRRAGRRQRALRLLRRHAARLRHPAPIGAFSAPRMLELARASSRRHRGHHAPSRWARSSAGCARTTWSSTTGSTTGCWATPAGLRHPRLERRRDEPARAAARAVPRHLPVQHPRQPGGLAVLGTPVDLDRSPCRSSSPARSTDHLTPWTGCYRTTELLSGPSTFVLSNAGHIASLVNPPGNPKASYWTGGEPGHDPDAWLETAEQRTGTWWEAWADWVLDHSGEERPAPPRQRRPPTARTGPGSYVLDRTPA